MPFQGASQDEPTKTCSQSNDLDCYIHPTELNLSSESEICTLSLSWEDLYGDLCCEEEDVRRNAAALSKFHCPSHNSVLLRRILLQYMDVTVEMEI